MKAFLTILLGLALGLGTSYLFFNIRTNSTTESFPIDGWPNTGKTVPPQADFVISSPTSIMLPSVNSGKLTRHQVFIENVGPAEGEIWLDELPNGIKLLKLKPGERKRIAPYSRYLLDVGIVGDFGQSDFDRDLWINTNLAEMPKLFVQFKTNIFPGIGVLPERSVTFTSKDFSEKKSKEVFVLTWLADSMSIKSINFPTNSELFTTEILDISDDKRAELKTGRAGKMVRITPLGEFPESREKIIMSIQVEGPDLWPLEVAIRFGE
jgi:hypothetical protein